MIWAGSATHRLPVIIPGVCGANGGETSCDRHPVSVLPLTTLSATVRGRATNVISSHVKQHVRYGVMARS